MCSEEDTSFFLLEICSGKVTFASRFFDISLRLLFLTVAGKLVDEGVFRGENHIGSAKKRVRPGGKDSNGFTDGRKLEFHISTLRTADPVALQLFYPFGPIQIIQPRQ